MDKRVLELEKESLSSIMATHTSDMFALLDRVAYIPMHADYDITHEDVEWGVVSSTNDKFVFVKFDKQVSLLGFNSVTAHSCKPEDLIIIR